MTRPIQNLTPSWFIYRIVSTISTPSEYVLAPPVVLKVKTGAVETQQRFGKTAIYHHKIIESEVYAKETELETKLKLDLIFEICDSVSDCSEKDGCLCVNRIVLLGDEVKNLQVCGK